MRDAKEIQQAHDKLNAILCGAVRHPCPESENILHAVHDALCWVLAHDDPKQLGFAQVLGDIDEHFKAQGVKLLPFSHPQHN